MSTESWCVYDGGPQVRLLYPLPCEDPHGSLRRQYHAGRSLHREEAGWQTLRESVEVTLPAGVCPTRCYRHALIKLLGRSQKDLGQGVFPLCPCEHTSRRRVELTSGGEYCGSMSFDLLVLLKRTGTHGGPSLPQLS